MKTVAFFNNKGGVGQTSLVYHLAWMYAELGVKVLAVDLDPQANLTAMFLDEETIEELWTDGRRGVLAPIRPLLEGGGGIEEPVSEEVADIALLAGDLSLSSFEDEFSTQWSRCHERDNRAFRVIAAFHEVVARCASAREATLVLIDVGPNLGAINRAALIAADLVAIPLAPDLFSLKGLEHLGPRLRDWRAGWQERLGKCPQGLDLPQGRMQPLGYVVIRHLAFYDEASARWSARIPSVYRERVLGEASPEAGVTIERDPHCISTLYQFSGLMPMAREVRKPMFLLRPADGAIGAGAQLVQRCYRDFRSLACEIARRAGVGLP